MKIIWEGEDSAEIKHFAFTQREVALIYKILGRLSLNDLKDREFNGQEIEEIQSLYYQLI